MNILPLSLAILMLPLKASAANLAGTTSLAQILQLARFQPVFKQALLDEIKSGPDMLIGAAYTRRAAGPATVASIRQGDIMRAQAHRVVRGLLADLGTVVLNRADLAGALGEKGYKDLWYASKSLSEIEDLELYLAGIRVENLLDDAADKLDALFDGDRGPHSPVVAGGGNKKPLVGLTKGDKSKN